MTLSIKQNESTRRPTGPDFYDSTDSLERWDDHLVKNSRVKHLNGSSIYNLDLLSIICVPALESEITSKKQVDDFFLTKTD